VAANGILSTNALAMADNHTIIMNANQGFPPVISIAVDDRSFIIPVWTAVPTMINNPAKKISVDQSTSRNIFSGSALVMINKMAAPPNAIIDGCMRSEPWITT
jgi:hypothetical protein